MTWIDPRRVAAGRRWPPMNSVSDHAQQRCHERLGRNLTREEWQVVLADITSGRVWPSHTCGDPGVARIVVEAAGSRLDLAVCLKKGRTFIASVVRVQACLPEARTPRRPTVDALGHVYQSRMAHHGTRRGSARDSFIPGRRGMLWTCC